jgi:hypothetical protein
MKYTIILKDKSVFYTDWYDYKRHWTDEKYFMIINNISCQYSTNGEGWFDIEDIYSLNNK